MNTYADVLNAYDIEVPAHLVADAEVPVISGETQRQGDVIFRATRPGKVENLKPIPAQGVIVVRGESGGNTHTLVGGGSWAPNTTDRAICGTLVVETDADPAFLIHPEHGASAFGKGTYIARRQRQQAEEIALVSD